MPFWFVKQHGYREDTYAWLGVFSVGIYLTIARWLLQHVKLERLLFRSLCLSVIPIGWTLGCQLSDWVNPISIVIAMCSADRIGLWLCKHWCGFAAQRNCCIDLGSTGFDQLHVGRHFRVDPIPHGKERPVGSIVLIRIRVRFCNQRQLCVGLSRFPKRTKTWIEEKTGADIIRVVTGDGVDMLSVLSLFVRVVEWWISVRASRRFRRSISH